MGGRVHNLQTFPILPKFSTKFQIGRFHTKFDWNWTMRFWNFTKEGWTLACHFEGYAYGWELCFHDTLCTPKPYLWHNLQRINLQTLSCLVVALSTEGSRSPTADRLVPKLTWANKCMHQSSLIKLAGHIENLQQVTELKHGPTWILRDSYTSLSRLQKLTVL